MTNEKGKCPALFCLLPIILFYALSRYGGISFADDPVERGLITAHALWPTAAAHPGDHVTLKIVVDISKGWYIIADEGQVGAFNDFKPYPTRIHVSEAAEGMTIDPVHFPPARAIDVDFAGGRLMSFRGRSVFDVPIRLEKQIPPGLIPMKVELAYQACSKNICLFPKTVTLETVLCVVDEEPIQVNSGEVK